MIRAAIIAPSRPVRVGLRVLLSVENVVEVIGEGAALDELRHPPLAAADVVVVQGRPGSVPPLPSNVRGLLFVVEDASSIAVPDTARAWGLVPAEAASDELVAAVQALYNGLIIVHPNFAAQIFVQPAIRMVDEREPPAEALTARELEVLQLIGQGLANKMIADRLHISEHTVKFHVSAIYAKLGVASRTEAVRAGARQGLIVL